MCSLQQRIGVFDSGNGAASVIDLSGSTPSKSDFTLPVLFSTAYVASSASQWLIGNQHGVILEGASLATTLQYLGYGTAWSIAGGTGRVAVATAIGEMLF